MSETTKISWCHHTMSPWIGCTKTKDSGCQNCYAAAMEGRFGVKWGPNGTRRRTANSTWKQVERWNRNAACCCCSRFERTGEHIEQCPQRDRPRVFPSLCDPFEDWKGRILDSHGDLLAIRDGKFVALSAGGSMNQASVKRFVNLDDVRRDFFALIDRCPNLDFLLLTKRLENIPQMTPYFDGAEMSGDLRFRHNVWLLYSASDQQSLESGLPHLQACRDLVPVWGLSLEPLLGPINLRLPELGPWRPRWIIVGGESGPHFRPIKQHYIADVARQCEQAGVPVYVKQFCGLKPGQQGRIPDDIWNMKQFPKGA